MAYTVNSRRRESMGSMDVAFLELDVTSYDATEKEDTSASALGIDQDPVFLTCITDENGGFKAAWDKSNQHLEFYEAGADGAALDEVSDTTDVGVVQVMAVF